MHKLSKLQKVILILLRQSDYSTMPRRAFNEEIYRIRFGEGWVTDAQRRLESHRKSTYLRIGWARRTRGVKLLSPARIIS